MIVNAMPVLHARTYNIDFRTGKLLIEPESFSLSDSAAIYKIATESTRRRELAPPCGRYVIYGSGSYAVVGRTVRFVDLYSRCGKEPKYIKVDKENGRLAYGFVGLMLKTGNHREPFVLSDELILDIYERCIAKRWDEGENDENAYDTMKMGFMDFNVQSKEKVAEFEPLLEQSASPIILEDTEELRDQIVYSAMSQAFKGKKISLCTSVSMFDRDTFSVVTCENAESKIQEIQSAINRISHSELQESDPRKAYSRTNFTKNTGKAISEIEKGEKTIRTNTQNRVKSLDDLLRETDVPDDFKVGFQKKTEKNQERLFDKGLILGTFLGITFIVVEIAKNSSPVLIAITSTATVVLAGIEAKRIIEKLSS